jgi:hypothetical protein
VDWFYLIPSSNDISSRVNNCLGFFFNKQLFRRLRCYISANGRTLPAALTLAASYVAHGAATGGGAACLIMQIVVHLYGGAPSAPARHRPLLLCFQRKVYSMI